MAFTRMDITLYLQFQQKSWHNPLASDKIIKHHQKDLGQPIDKKCPMIQNPM